MEGVSAGGRQSVGGIQFKEPLAYDDTLLLIRQFFGAPSGATSGIIKRSRGRVASRCAPRLLGRAHDRNRTHPSRGGSTILILFTIGDGHVPVGGEGVLVGQDRYSLKPSA